MNVHEPVVFLVQLLKPLELAVAVVHEPEPPVFPTHATRPLLSGVCHVGAEAEPFDVSTCPLVPGVVPAKSHEPSVSMLRRCAALL
jgi:hypothetical protein